MKRGIALTLALTVALSMFAGVAVADTNIDAPDHTTESDTLDVTGNHTAEYYVAVWDNSSRVGNATMDNGSVTGANNQSSPTLDVSNATNGSVYVAIMETSTGGQVNPGSDTDVANQTVMMYDVSVTVDDQNVSTNATVNLSADDEYRLVVWNEDDDELMNTTVDSSTDNVSVDVSEELANNSNFTMTAELQTTDGESITSDNGTIMLDDSGSGGDGGFLGLFSGNDLPVIGGLPLVGSLSPLGLGILLVVILLAAGGGGYIYQRDEEPAEVAYVD